MMNTAVDLIIVILSKTGEQFFQKQKVKPCLVELPKSKFAFYFDILNILIIFMQIRYI